jgi:hypothetical protein
MSDPVSRREVHRILIIDDDPDTLLTLPALLKSRIDQQEHVSRPLTVAVSWLNYRVAMVTIGKTSK